MKAIDRANAYQKKLNDSEDFKMREILFKTKKGQLIFLNEIVDGRAISQNIIFAINAFKNKKDLDMNTILAEVVSVDKAEIITADADILDRLLRGNAVLFIDDTKEALAFNVAKFESRGITEPPSSSVVKGPREGFTESIRTNIALIRKRLLTPTLKIEALTVGRRTKTAVRLLYLTDVADKRIIKKIKDKIEAIDIDGIIDSYYIAQFLEERPYSCFKQVGNSEKPDIICAKILEGRVAIAVDGSPIVLTLPFMLSEDLQSSNDYYGEYNRASMLRFMRAFGAILSIFAPGLYIAVELYHYKLLPLNFLITIVNSTQNLPLSPLLEIVLVLILFEILFEATIRMPKHLGSAISIVGGIILGDTAVKAGLVSPPAVMIVAVSAITIYTIPDQSAQISLLRIIFTIIGGILGFEGLLLGGIVLITYLSNFDTYFTPYLAPLAPYIKSDGKDFLMVKNRRAMDTRPYSIPNNNRVRMRKKDEVNSKN